MSKEYHQTIINNAHDWHTCPAVEQIEGKVSGTWVFQGTRVPVRALFENLQDGASVGDFLSWFQGVQEDQVRAIMEHEIASLLV